MTSVGVNEEKTNTIQPPLLVFFSPSTKGILDYIHFDLWGPSKVTSYGGRCYMMTIIDDFSRKVLVYFLWHKNETFPTFRKWKILVETQIGKNVKKLRTDNGLEFCSGDFHKSWYC